MEKQYHKKRRTPDQVEKECFQSNIKSKLGEKEVFLPWIQLNASYSYSLVRDLNVFEWLILESLNQTFMDRKALTLKDIAKIAGIDERDIEFLKPFLTNLCLNKTLQKTNLISKTTEDLGNYSCTDHGLSLALKGKTEVREQYSSIRLYYSPLISDYIAEREISFQQLEPEKMLYLTKDQEFFQKTISEIAPNYLTPNLKFFSYQKALNPEKLIHILKDLNIFLRDEELSISPSISLTDPELKWEKRMVSVGLDHEDQLCAEIQYEDPNFNAKLSELLRQGALCNHIIKLPLELD